MNPREDAWPRPLVGGERRPKILVVDSHPLFGASLAKLLGEPPLLARVEVVSDGAAARAQPADFDLMICEVSGTSFAAGRLLQDGLVASRQVPLVLLADGDEEDLLLDAVDSGAAGFFTKDCAPDEFIAGISSVLDGQHAVGRRLIPGMLARLNRGRRAEASRPS
jgi:two-component system invasion response regulator UvrY